MGAYQGGALRRASVPPPGRGFRRFLTMVALLLAAAVLAQLPWDAMRRGLLRIRQVRVEGTRYLGAPEVAAIAGIAEGRDLLALDVVRARQALLLHPRIESARVTRRWPHAVTIRVVERVPVLLVRHGVPWELDSTGVLLAPLADGVVADVPLLAGPSFAGLAGGTRVGTPEVRRGLAWVRALSEHALQLSGSVSEIDVSQPRTTELLLMNGTRVRAQPWPPGLRTLSALRVVLADLARRGAAVQEVDVRFRHQVIVRPAAVAGTET